MRSVANSTLFVLNKILELCYSASLYIDICPQIDNSKVTAKLKIFCLFIIVARFALNGLSTPMFIYRFVR